MKQLLTLAVLGLVTAATVTPSFATPRYAYHNAWFQSYGYPPGYASWRGRICAPIYDSAGAAVACR